MDDAQRSDLEKTLALAGEFLVVGELLRRRIEAAFIYGNAKVSTVVAKNEAVTIPLKINATRDAQWDVHFNSSPNENSVLVLVNLPRGNRSPVEFFVLTESDLQAVIKPKHEQRQKGSGGPRRPPRSYPITTAEIAEHADAWDKIRKRLRLRAEPSEQPP